MTRLRVGRRHRDATDWCGTEQNHSAAAKYHVLHRLVTFFAGDRITANAGLHWLTLLGSIDPLQLSQQEVDIGKRIASCSFPPNFAGFVDQDRGMKFDVLEIVV